MGLLNTPIIGRLVASVDSSSIDMLAGLSKWSIFEDPALLLRRCRPHGQQQRARSREHAKISLHFVRLPFVTRAEKTRIAAVPALFGLPAVAFLKAATPTRAGGNVREVITYRIRGTGARYRRPIASLLGPPERAACRARGLRRASCARPRVSSIDVSKTRECRSREPGSGTLETPWAG